MRNRRKAANVTISVLAGVALYYVFGEVLPYLFSTVGITSALAEKSTILAYIVLLIALKVAGSLLDGKPMSIPLKGLSKVVAAMLLIVGLNWGILEGEIVHGELVFSVKINITLFLWVVVTLILIYGIIDVASSHKP